MACGDDARGAIAGNPDGARVPFVAARGHDDGFGLDFHRPIFRGNIGDDFVFGDVEDVRPELIFDAALLHLLDEAGEEFRPGQLFFEFVEAETIMDALIEDAPEELGTLQNEDVADPLIISGDGRGHAGGSTADDH